MIDRWVRPFLALVALVALIALGGCGGGSGAPNNPFAPKPPAITPVFLLPPAETVYSHTPATLTVSGGAAPYQAFSSNASILPVGQAVNGTTVVLLANDVAAPTAVTITVQDSVGQTATASITVSPAPLIGGLTITPADTSCVASSSSSSSSSTATTNVVCSGTTATATVQVTGPGGAGIANRQVRFDVVAGAFAIQSSNPAQPLVATLTVASDANGNASVILRAAVNAPTQPAQLRATDLTTGNAVIGNFTIVQVVNGSTILSVVPATATITGPDTATCTTGFKVDYFIYGGTPPYHISSTFPEGATLVNAVVAAAGGFFEAITNGTCVNPLTFTIVDATGRQITAQLINQPGTAAPPPPPAGALSVTPPSYSVSGAASCTGKTFGFVITGGTPPFSVASPGGVVAPNPVATTPGTFTVSGFTDGSGAHTIFIGDAAKPQQGATATVTCN
jgi:hypothetical protein